MRVVSILFSPFVTLGGCISRTVHGPKQNDNSKAQIMALAWVG